MVAPRYGPRGMMVTLCSGSVSRQDHVEEGVAGLVPGGGGLFLVVHGQAAALAAPADLVAGLFEFSSSVDGLEAAAGGEQGGFVDEVGQFGAGEAGRAAGDVARDRRRRRV